MEIGACRCLSASAECPDAVLCLLRIGGAIVPDGALCHHLFGDWILVARPSWVLDDLSAGSVHVIRDRGGVFEQSHLQILPWTGLATVYRSYGGIISRNHLLYVPLLQHYLVVQAIFGQRTVVGCHHCWSHVVFGFDSARIFGRLLWFQGRTH